MRSCRHFGCRRFQQVQQHNCPSDNDDVDGDVILMMMLMNMMMLLMLFIAIIKQERQMMMMFMMLIVLILKPEALKGSTVFIRKTSEKICFNISTENKLGLRLRNSVWDFL